MLDRESALQKSFSVKEKREYIVAIDALMAEGVFCRQACLMFGLPHNYYPCFKKVIKKLGDLEQDAGFVPFKQIGLLVRFIQVIQVFYKPFRKTCIDLILKSGDVGYTLVPL